MSYLTQALSSQIQKTYALGDSVNTTLTELCAALGTEDSNGVQRALLELKAQGAIANLYGEGLDIRIFTRDR